MANKETLVDLINAIANAIKEKNEEAPSTMTLSQMPEYIRNISGGGGTQSGYRIFGTPVYDVDNFALRIYTSDATIPGNMAEDSMIRFTGQTTTTNTENTQIKYIYGVDGEGNEELLWQYVAPKFTITSSSGENGSINPVGENEYELGSSATYNFTANSGYEVEDVLVDGNSVGNVTSYTFENINSNHTISVSFKIARPSSVRLNWSFENLNSNTDGIFIYGYIQVPENSGVGEHKVEGTNSYTGFESLKNDGSKTLTFHAYDHCVITDVIVDDESLGSIESYTINFEEGNEHSIKLKCSHAGLDSYSWLELSDIADQISNGDTEKVTLMESLIGDYKSTPSNQTTTSSWYATLLSVNHDPSNGEILTFSLQGLFPTLVPHNGSTNATVKNAAGKLLLNGGISGNGWGDEDTSTFVNSTAHINGTQLLNNLGMSMMARSVNRTTPTRVPIDLTQNDLNGKTINEAVGANPYTQKNSLKIWPPSIREIGITTWNDYSSLTTNDAKNFVYYYDLYETHTLFENKEWASASTSSNTYLLMNSSAKTNNYNTNGCVSTSFGSSKVNLLGRNQSSTFVPFISL